MPRTQKVVRVKSVGVTPSGKEVFEEKTQVSDPEMEQAAEQTGIIWTVIRCIYYVAGVIEVLLLFRFILKMLGANPGSDFVALVYSVSSIFEAPFRGIFRSAVTTGLEVRSIVEPSTLVAILVYAIVAVGVVELVKVVTASREVEEE